MKGTNMEGIKRKEIIVLNIYLFEVNKFITPPPKILLQ
jgi:hypothetical protein